MVYYTREKKGGGNIFKTVDLRVLRTKKSIMDAFIKLLQTKNFEKITVTDIAKVANINRRTFYIHYADIFSLLEEFENNLTDEFQKEVTDKLSQDLYEFQMLILDFLCSHRLLMIALLSNSASNFLSKVMQIANDAGFATSEFKKQEEQKYWWNYIKHGMCYVLLEWLKSQDLSRDQMVRLSTKLISNT